MGLGAMRVWLNHAGRPCRIGRGMLPRCGPGVVSDQVTDGDLKGDRERSG
jgi:hypothetical protein